MEKIIGDFSQKSSEYNAKLNSFFFENNGNECEHADNSFPFRYCSGGVLSIITIEGKHYYRLHWRDIHPVVWNITNGGSDSIAEMLDPASIIKRELCEESVLFDLKPDARRRLVLSEQSLGEDAFPSESWRKWHKRLVEQERSDLRVKAFTNEVLPCGWLRGPDRLADITSTGNLLSQLWVGFSWEKYDN